jgi:hypothetical protein
MSRRVLVALALLVGAAGSFAGVLYAGSLVADMLLGALGVGLAAAAGAALRSDLPGTRTGELDRFTSTFRGF